jgi:hypothetical protein
MRRKTSNEKQTTHTQANRGHKESHSCASAPHSLLAAAARTGKHCCRCCMMRHCVTGRQHRAPAPGGWPPGATSRERAGRADGHVGLQAVKEGRASGAVQHIVAGCNVVALLCIWADGVAIHWLIKDTACRVLARCLWVGHRGRPRQQHRSVSRTHRDGCDAGPNAQGNAQTASKLLALPAITARCHLTLPASRRDVLLPQKHAPRPTPTSVRKLTCTQAP